MKRRNYLVTALAGLAGARGLATDNQIALSYNWNGICHASESNQPDLAAGFRSIADRALYADGSANAIGGSPVVGVSGITYSINMNPGALDCIHLGSTIVYTP